MTDYRAVMKLLVQQTLRLAGAGGSDRLAVDRGGDVVGACMYEGARPDARHSVNRPEKRINAPREQH